MHGEQVSGVENKRSRFQGTGKRESRVQVLGILTPGFMCRELQVSGVGRAGFRCRGHLGGLLALADRGAVVVVCQARGLDHPERRAVL